MSSNRRKLQTTFTDTAAGNYPFGVPTDHSFAFTGIIKAQKDDQTERAMWVISGTITNDSGTTTLDFSEVDEKYNSNGYTLALSADDTNDCLQIQLTAEATVNATASLHFVEQSSANFYLITSCQYRQQKTLERETYSR